MSSSQIGPSSGNGEKGGGRGGEEGGGKEKEEAKRGAENDADNENGEEGEASSDSGADSDEFSDVVVLDPLGREEERPSKQPNSPQKEAQQPKSPQANSSNSQQQTPQIQQSRIPEMDPSPVYPNLEHSAHQQHGPNSQQQSWFSSTQLPSFLAKSANEAEDGSQTSASASMFRILGELRARLQPWGEFFRPAKFGLPPGLVAIGPRIKHNLGHFLSNYLCLFVVLLIYCILTSLLMLLTLIVLAGLCYTIYQRTQKGPIILGGQEIPASLLYTLALMVCIPLFYMANAGSVMYWVIGTGLFLMLAHAIFYASEEVPGQEFEVVSVVTA